MKIVHSREPSDFGEYTDDLVVVAEDGDFECECDTICAQDEAICCSICNRWFCPACWKAAHDELGGGLDAGNSGLDVCYNCSERTWKNIV